MNMNMTSNIRKEKKGRVEKEDKWVEREQSEPNIHLLATWCCLLFLMEIYIHILTIKGGTRIVFI